MPSTRSFPRRIACALFTLALLLPAALRAQSQTTPTPSTVSTRTLANGLQVVVVEDHAAAVVQTAVWYRFGSLYETPGKTGLAHALEHMMFRGTPQLSEGGLDDLGARLGAQVNANTANDYTHYYFVLPADQMDLALHIEADRMQHLLLKESDWKLERGAVLAEIDGDFSQPFSKLYYAVRAATFPNSPHGLTALGVRADVAKSSAADLRRYYEQWYAPNNATVVVTGDVKPDAVFASAEKWFAGIPSRALPQNAVPAPVPAHDKTLTVTADYPFEVVDMAYAIPGDIEPGNAAVTVLAAVINNQRSAFFKSLVESGLTLGYSADTDTELRTGVLHLLFVVNAGHTPKEVQDAFNTTLAQSLASGFPDDLVGAAKKGVAAQAIYAREALDGLGDRYGYALGIEGRKDPAEDDALVAAVSVADVNAAAKTYLAAPNVVGYLKPQPPKPGAKGATGSASSSVSDNFTSRAPSGPIVQPAWVKTALAQPNANHSKVEPVSFTLSNGIHVLVQNDAANPTVFVRGGIETSPRAEPKGKEGIAGIAGDLLSYGSEKYDFTAQRKISDDLAANIDLGASFGAHGLAKDLPTLLSVLADGEMHPALPDQYIELVRSQAISSISRRERNPDYLAQRAFSRLLLSPNDPSLRQSSVASMKAITKADIAAYIASNYRPDLTTIAVVGDVQPDDVRTQLEKAFGAWTASGAKPDVSQLPIPLKKPATAHIPTARAVVNVRLGQPLPSRRSPDFYALNLMNQILGAGGTFDTRLMSEIRAKRGLVYGVSSSIDVNKYRGSLEFSLSASPSKVGSAIALLKAQLVRLQNERVSKDELDRARSKLVGGALVGEEATTAVTGEILNIGLNGLPADYYKHLAERYAGVTPADIQRVAKMYLKPRNLVEVYEGPRS